MAYFPVFIKLKNVLVVGAGNVASRKIETLLQFIEDNSKVKIVAPEISEKVQKLYEENKSKIELVQKKFEESDLENIEIVFAATNSNETDELISKLCREKHILANIADVAHLCDFHFPAIVKRGDFVVGINSSGDSPALTRKVREKINELLPQNLGEKLKKIGEIRKKSLKDGIKPSENSEYLKLVEEITLEN